MNIYHDNIDLKKDRASLPRSMMVVGTTITSREKVLMKTYSRNFSVTTVYNCLMELYTHFYKILLFMKMYLPSSFILRYVRAEMNVLAFMNELDQKDY